MLPYQHGPTAEPSTDPLVPARQQGTMTIALEDVHPLSELPDGAFHEHKHVGETRALSRYQHVVAIICMLSMVP